MLLYTVTFVLGSYSDETVIVWIIWLITGLLTLFLDFHSAVYFAMRYNQL